MQTNALKTILAQQLASPSSQNAITKVGFGEGSIAPSPTDSALTNPYMKNIDSYAILSASAVKFNYSLGYNEANGKTIKEVGLFTTGGILVAREVRNTIEKDSDTSLSGSITILF
jgi:hypothetical protein